jgi:site-specific DNA-methyltransferase (adenine-specific)
LSRRRDKLSWAHHREVAALPAPTADALLNAAEAEGWSQKALRRHVRQDRERVTAALADLVDTGSNRHELFHSSLVKALDREAGLFDWIVTDPPYGREYLDVYSDLGRVAAHALKEGGSLLCMTGQSYLPEVLARLCEHLSYHWTLAYLTPGGQAVQIFPRRVNTFWKPVLWLTKADYQGDWIGDVTRSSPNDNDKRFHDWGQSESGMADLMSRFVKPGDWVMDPFMGGGTTGAVAMALGAYFVGYDDDDAAFNEAVVRLDRARLVA